MQKSSKWVKVFALPHMKYKVYFEHQWLQMSLRIRKALLVLLFLPFITVNTSTAQDPMAVANQELRHLFQNIGNPHTNVKFFYDLSAHIVDSSLFDDNWTDTGAYLSWSALYNEMWWMAYDTTAYQKVANIIAQANTLTSNDIIPIGIMDWDYNLLKPDALTTGTYFDFDTVNNVLYDKPGAPNPFLFRSTFSASPLATTTPYLNPTFTIRPQFIFKDPLKTYHMGSGNNSLRINFGDGTGWHSFQGNITENYVANYTSSGRRTIRTQVLDKFGNLLKQSISSIIITGNTTVTPVDSVISLPGLTANIYNPPGCTLNAPKKYVIYLEGFDMLNSRSASSVYSSMIVSDNIVQLKNQGYSFIVVNWNDARTDLRDNAEALKGLLMALICEYRNNGDEIHPFVIIGESMGGLIARYTLCEMEKPNPRILCPLPSDQYAYHNTRLLITLDAPHQGANIPIGLQYLYQNVSNGAMSVLQFSGVNNFILNQLFTGLDSDAAKQMLIYHIQTDNFYSMSQSSSPITQHHLKTEFDNALRDLGNYPRYCKLVAVSNGSWIGSRQEEPFGDNNQRQPHDALIQVDAATQLRILGIPIVGTTFAFEARTNPDGAGNVFRLSSTVSRWKIKLKWFGFSLKWHTEYLTNLDKSVEDVKPYCVMPGSTLLSEIGLGDTTLNESFKYGGFGLMGAATNSNAGDFLGVFGVQRTSSGNGDLQLLAYTSNFLGGFYAGVNAFSNGTGFTFIPTYSSFDYEHMDEPLDHPILADPVPINDILRRTPFDVVITNPDSLNRNHLENKNPELELYASCNNFPGVRSRLLNREIGDDSLWLENYTAAYTGVIETERDILINERNIYYNYDNVFALNKNLFSADKFPDEYNEAFGAIVLSKQRSVDFIMPGSLRSNDALTVNGAQPPTGSYSWTQGAMTNCCVDFQQRPGDYKEEGASKAKHTGYMQLYPNPASNHLTIKYQLSTNVTPTIYVYNSMGQLAATWHPKFEDHTQHCYFNISTGKLGLSSGVYAVALQAGEESHNTKLIIK